MRSVWAYSEAGDGRPNLDAFTVREIEPNIWFVAIADGQGGRAGGERAACLACETARIAMTAEMKVRSENELLWSHFVKLADDAVLADDTAGLITLIALLAVEQRIVGASQGDSAAWLVTESTADELTGRQNRRDPVGSGLAMPVSFSFQVNGSWRLLLMTDGVWKYVGLDRIIAAARRTRGTELMTLMTQAGRLPGSGKYQDDFTVVLIENEDNAAIR